MAAGKNKFGVFENPAGGFRAIPVGFNWAAALLTWIWALAKGHWLPALGLIALDLVLFLVLFPIPDLQLSVVLFRGAIAVGLAYYFGSHGNPWQADKLEARGFKFLGVIEALSAGSALDLMKTGNATLVRHRALLSAASVTLVPKSLQPIAAIAALTWKAAFRFRLFWVLLFLLMVTVTVLPAVIKDDGTPRGFIQIMLTYTLSLMTVLLGFSTLWLACGTLARDIEDCQMQVVATKPVARWQIWLGKWIGLSLLNLALLSIAGASVYFFLLYRAAGLPAEQRAVLNNEIFVARGSLKEPMPDLKSDAERIVEERMKNPEVSGAVDRATLRTMTENQLKARHQVVMPGYLRQWKLDLGFLKERLNAEQLFARIKFFVAQTNEANLYRGLLKIGPPETTKVQVLDRTFSAETFHEIALPMGMADEKGILTVEFHNRNDTTLLFQLDDGFELLYRESGFGLNFVRGLTVVFCWLVLLAAVGLAAGSFLSFPVAALVSVAILLVGLSGGTLQNVVEEGTVLGSDHETGKPINKSVDFIMVPLFRGLLFVVNVARDFSPVDALSSGRSITWISTGTAVVQIVGLAGGMFAALGIYAFHRRELARTQASS